MDEAPEYEVELLEDTPFFIFRGVFMVVPNIYNSELSLINNRVSFQ